MHTMIPSGKMKRKIVFLFAFILLPLATLFSQGGQVQERLKAQQVAFFTQKMKLSPDEAKVFWPVYDDYSRRRETLRIEERNLLRSVALNGENMSDEELGDTMKKYIENQNEGHELFVNYNNRFQKILPPEKVLLIYVAENQFKQYLLEQIRENRRGKGPGRY